MARIQVIELVPTTLLLVKSVALIAVSAPLIVRNGISEHIQHAAIAVMACVCLPFSISCVSYTHCDLGNSHTHFISSEDLQAYIETIDYFISDINIHLGRGEHNHGSIYEIFYEGYQVLVD